MLTKNGKDLKIQESIYQKFENIHKMVSKERATKRFLQASKRLFRSVGIA